MKSKSNLAAASLYSCKKYSGVLACVQNKSNFVDIYKLSGKADSAKAKLTPKTIKINARQSLYKICPFIFINTDYTYRYILALFYIRPKSYKQFVKSMVLTKRFIIYCFRIHKQFAAIKSNSKIALGDIT